MLADRIFDGFRHERSFPAPTLHLTNPCVRPLDLDQARTSASANRLLMEVSAVLHPVRSGAVAGVHEVETMAQRVVRQTISGGAIIPLALRLGLLAFLVYWSFVLVRPFIPILVWSMVLTVALYPPYNWLSVRLGDRPSLAAAIITVINLAIVIGPVTWIGYGVIDGLQAFARQL